MDARTIINGTWGEVWLDNLKVAEAKGLQAKIDFKKEDVNMCGQLGQDTKIVGWSGKGSLKMFKVNSRMGIKLGKMAKEGKDVRFTIISKLADPDALGAERVAIKSVSFDDLTLADWEAGKQGEIECPFTFSDYDYMDIIDK